MAHQLTGLSSQRGASVTSVIFIVMVIVVAGKLLMAILPAQLGDYQLTKSLGKDLQEANSTGETAKQFVTRVNQQWSINADYDTTAEDIFTFSNNQTGQLAIYKKYDKTSNLFGNVDIVNRFEGEIKPSSEQ
jgi:hypothetical protein